MCAGAEAELGKDKVSVYMGYYGGSINIGPLHYSTQDDAETCTRDELKARLQKETKANLAEMIATLIDTAEE